MIFIRFNNVSSDEMGVYWQSTDRTLLPARRVKQYEIPGRDGYYVDDQQTYGNRLITGVISFLGQDRDFETLRIKARQVAQWLSGSGQLIFSDEPDKAYQARVIAGVPLEQLARVGRCSVSFECQPYAESIDLHEQQTGIVNLPHTEIVEVDGTADTPCIIYITAESEITDLTIERKVTL